MIDGKWRTVKIVDVCESTDQFTVQYTDMLNDELRDVYVGVNGGDLREIRLPPPTITPMPFDRDAVKVGDYVQWIDNMGDKYKEEKSKETFSNENPRLEYDHPVYRLGRVQLIFKNPKVGVVMEVIYVPRPEKTRPQYKRWRSKTNIDIDQMQKIQTKIILETKEMPLDRR